MLEHYDLFIEEDGSAHVRLTLTDGTILRCVMPEDLAREFSQELAEALRDG